MDGRSLMSQSHLSLHLDAYLSFREALGFPMRVERTLLRDFIRCIEGRGEDGPIRAQWAVEWACALVSPARSGWSGATLEHGTGLSHLSAGDHTRDGSARPCPRRLVPSSQAVSFYSGPDQRVDARRSEGGAAERPAPSYLIHSDWVVGQHGLARRGGAPAHGHGCVAR